MILHLTKYTETKGEGVSTLSLLLMILNRNVAAQTKRARYRIYRDKKREKVSTLSLLLMILNRNVAAQTKRARYRIYRDKGRESKHSLSPPYDIKL